MDSFLIKIIAIITMLIDHTKNILSLRDVSLYMLGRVAFPLFAFQTTIGYEKTKDLKKYLLRLFIFAIISQIPFSIYYKEVLKIQELTLNIMFTLIIGIICMYVYDIKINPELEKKKIIIANIYKSIIIVLLIVLAQILNVDYQCFGVILILFIHIFYKNNKIIFSLGYITLITIQFILSYYSKVPLEFFIAMLVGGIIPLAIMLSYNGKKGKSLKYLFYVFYPAHLIILVMIKTFLIK